MSNAALSYAASASGKAISKTSAEKGVLVAASPFKKMNENPEAEI